jgi:hypothetical protein
VFSIDRIDDAIVFESMSEGVASGVMPWQRPAAQERKMMNKLGFDISKMHSTCQKTIFWQFYKIRMILVRYLSYNLTAIFSRIGNKLEFAKPKCNLQNEVLCPNREISENGMIRL